MDATRKEGLKLMKDDLKTRWLAALRSGEYKQGSGCLRYKNEYCCLGVLVELYSSDILVKNDVDGPYNWNGYSYVVGTPPFSFCSEIGMSTEIRNRLIEMNDDNGDSFKTIADYIEANVPITE